MFIIRIIFSICGWTKSSFHPDSVGTFAIIVLTNVAVFTNPPRPRPAPGLIIRLTGAGAGAVQGAGRCGAGYCLCPRSQHNWDKNWCTANISLVVINKL